MTMRCSVPDDTAASPSGSLVGRAAPDVTSQARRSSPSMSDVRAITSIAISRDGVDVAMVSEHIPARSLAEASMRVTGGIPGGPGERGFLQLTWDYPSNEQTGKYVCEVNALNDAGHNVVLQQPLDVDLGEATLADITNHIHALEVRDASKDSTIHTLQSDVQKCSTDIQAQKNEIASLRSQLAESRHIETGRIDCGRQELWPDKRNKQVSQRFTKAYSKSPIVHLSVTQIDASVTPSSYMYYIITLKTVDTASFTINCNSLPDFPNGHSQFIHLGVDWISFPQ